MFAEFIGASLADQVNIALGVLGIFGVIVGANIGLYRLINRHDKSKLDLKQTELANERAFHQKTKEQRDSYKAEINRLKGLVEKLEAQITSLDYQRIAPVERKLTTDKLSELEREIIAIFPLADVAVLSVNEAHESVSEDTEYTLLEVRTAMKQMEAGGWLLKRGKNASNQHYLLTDEAEPLMSRIAQQIREQQSRT